ncbi:MAG: CvpA family protein [Verrucomicrobia bacterium]|nr:CvpA family protein [Verrucomicrobiota bacterium]
MSIWLLAGALLVLFGVLGFFLGTVRVLITLVGFGVAALSAFPLAPLLKPLVPLMKVESPTWAAVLPPLIAFVLVELIFSIVAFTAHFLIKKKLSLVMDELGQAKFDRLNQRTGICFGLVAAVAHLLVIGLVIHVGGYPAAQFAQGGEGQGAVGMLAEARIALKETGLDKFTAKLDPMKDRYYEIADVMGLLYNNPVLSGRLGSYPAYLSLSEKQEFKDLAGDTEFLQMVQTKGDVVAVYEHAKTQAILNNSEIVTQITGVDLKDLRHFLETGKSPKFDEEPILGRWRVDANAVLRQAKKVKSDITAQELSQIKKLANTVLAGTVLTATPENQIFISAPPLPAPPKPPEDANALEGSGASSSAMLDPRYGVRQPPQPPRPTGVSPTALAPAIRQRFGGGGGAAAQGGGRGPVGGGGNQPTYVRPGQTAAPAVPAIKPEEVRVAGTGTWKSEGGTYEMALQTDAGASVKLKARLDKERLLVSSGPVTLVFEKVR